MVLRITLVSYNLFVYSRALRARQNTQRYYTPNRVIRYICGKGEVWFLNRTYAADFSGKLVIFFRYQRSIHKEFLLLIILVENLNANNMNLLAAAGYWRYDLQKQGIELRALRNPEHEYIRILGISTCIAELQSVYQDELFFKVKKNHLFFNFDSFGFSLFAFRFSTKALGKNINFVCFFNSERKWLVFPENPPHTFGWETKLPSSHKYILLDDLVFMLLGSTMLKASCAEQEKWWIFSSVRKWRNIFSASSVTTHRLSYNINSHKALSLPILAVCGMCHMLA